MIETIGPKYQYPGGCIFCGADFLVVCELLVCLESGCCGGYIFVGDLWCRDVRLGGVVGEVGR